MIAKVIADYIRENGIKQIFKRYEEAEEVFRQALEKKEDNLPIYNELGRMYVKQKRYEEAESIFIKVLNIENGYNKYILTSLIKLYHYTGQNQKADKLIYERTNKKTAFYDFYCRECYSYLKDTKRWEEAIKYSSCLCSSRCVL